MKESPSTHPLLRLIKVTDQTDEQTLSRQIGRFPIWLHRKLPTGNQLKQTAKIIQQHHLHTVCEEAKCPNRLECWSRKTATFLLMGAQCTRSCAFCAIDFAKTPLPLDQSEPIRIAESVKSLLLRHVVLTMVARDDLSDGGSAHLVAVMQAIRTLCPSVTIEILTSDFSGNEKAWQEVVEASPTIFNHNIETVKELSPRIRHKASYERSLALLAYVNAYRKKTQQNFKIKSGFMLGLGEKKEQVLKVLQDLRQTGCDIVTIGQYLQPDSKKIKVKQFIPPEQFKEYESYAYQIGFSYAYTGPFIRSSYNAEACLDAINFLYT